MPLEKGGTYCFAHVGRYVGRYVEYGWPSYSKLIILAEVELFFT